ncbi:hypothetical protein BKA67DRAFT_533746 [Truncatella angustata]|uniref:Uncharacterized protein n=1 Tax=Truncatella angustata TaxID=152316 RepID=A0A9P8UUT2_9PEZI|nr:uncharacterized protein BKA67DRAFT_533746 [Truncatella angustata]KAH6658613.1 hypothetical protein BKA67DRAFT_533746 [Truncatella angustata]
MSSAWFNNMDASQLPNFDLEALPDNRDFDFDILNGFPLNLGTDANSAQMSLSTDDDMKSKLAEICSRLERIEAGMATNTQLNRLNSVLESTTLQVNQRIETLTCGVDKLRRGLEAYSKTLVQTILAAGGADKMAKEMNDLPPLQINHNRMRRRNASVLQMNPKPVIVQAETLGHEAELQELHNENRELRERLKRLEERLLKKEAKIEHISIENKQRCVEIAKHKALVGRVAQNIAHAFKEYQDLTAQAGNKQTSSFLSSESQVGDIQIAYQEATSVWSHSDSE